MPRNVEIKARLDDVQSTIGLAKEVCGEHAEVIQQEDVFFHCRSGRLKLRIFADDSGELIVYHRPDLSGPKTCSYVISAVVDPKSMRNALDQACGTRTVVRKTRTLFFSGRTRVHIDQVEGVGDFLELEVVLEDGENESSGIAEAHDLMSRLNVSSSSLVDRAYVDLIEAQSTDA